MAAAENWACPAGVLQQLAVDPDDGVRFAVAGNLSVPPEALEVLVRDRDPATAEAAAANPGCPAYLRVLWQLAHDTT
jgi:hypothetical protein